MQPKRKDVQILRGIAIIAVVIIHTYPIGHEGGVLIRAFVNFAVALFFFLSGYLTNSSIDSERLFNRIKKVFFPYIVWSLIYGILPGRNGFNIIPEKLLIGLLTGSCCFHLYFIIVYIQLIILTKACLFLLRSKLKYVCLLITPAALLFFEYLLPFWSITIPKSIADINVLEWFTYYYIGLGVGNHEFTFTQLHKSITAIVFALVISIAEGLFWFTNGNYRMATTQCRLSSCFYSIAVLFLCSNLLEHETLSKINGKYLIVFGELSGGIYFLHVLIIKIFKILGRIIPLVSVFPVNSLLTLVFSAIVIVFIKKYFSPKFCAMLGF